MAGQLRLSRRSIVQAAGVAGLSLLTPRAKSADTREVPWLADIQRQPATLPPDAPQLGDLLVDDSGKRITTVADWTKRRGGLRNWWLEFLGPMPARRPSPPKLSVVEEDSTDGVIRQLVRYEIEPEMTTEAYLLKPQRQTGKAPGIVVFHSTVNYTIRQPAGLEGPPEKHFGLRFAKKGCVCFCPRNFLWPQITQERLNANAEVKKLSDRAPQSKGMAKMLYDALVAVDVLAALPEVDAARLGTVGHSLGAKEALYIAAFDDRIKAAVSSEGGIGTKFSNWDAPWYLGASIKEPAFTHEHHELLAMAAPRPFLLVGGNSADGDRGWPFIAAAKPVYELCGKPARIGQYVHGQGHAVPPEAEQRIDEWLMTYL
ncbi:MAG TPA: dienelactone hydrolase family protein [Pirellulaceae bacterium]|jgi:dienelactone hydrolase